MVEFEINGVKLQMDTGDTAFLESFMMQLEAISTKFSLPDTDAVDLEFMKKCNDAIHDVVRNLYGEDILDAIIINKTSFTESMRLISTLSVKFNESKIAVEKEINELSKITMQALSNEQAI